MAPTELTRVPCTTETRDEILRPLKRGGENYDELLRKMAEQYDPDRTGAFNNDT